MLKKSSFIQKEMRQLKSQEVFHAYASSASGVLSRRYSQADVERVKKFFNRDKIFSQLNAMVSFLIPDRSNVKLYLNVGGGSFTDGKSITVGLPHIFIKSSYEEIFTVLQALTGHEAQHINSSDFEAYTSYQKDVADAFVKKYTHMNESILRGYMQKISVAFGNGVEDGRIEKILGAKFPGYIKYLKFMNGSMWNAQEIKGNSELEDFLYCIVSYSVTGLAPKGFNKVWKGTELEENFNKIKPMIMKGINATTCRLCLSYCKDMISMIEPYLVKLLEKRTKEDEEFLNNLPDQPEFTTSSEVDYNTDPSTSTHFKPEKQEQDNNETKKTDKKEEGKEEQKQKKQNSSSKQTEEQANKKSESKDSDDEKDKNQGESSSKNGEESDENNIEKSGGNTSKDTNDDQLSEDDENASGSGSEENSDDDSEKEDSEKNGSGEDEQDSDDESEDGKEDGENNSDSENESDSKSNSNPEQQPGDGDEYDDNLSDSEQIPDEDIVKGAIEELIQEIQEDAKDKVSEEPMNNAKKSEDKSEADSKLTDYELSEIKDLYKNDVAKNFSEERGFSLRHPLPAEYKTVANRFRKEMERLFKNKEQYNLRGQKRGLLDASNLWKMGVKETNVFVKKGMPVLNDYVAYLLWDGSGSMGSDNKEYHSGFAISVAEEGLKGLVPFKVTQFSVGNRGVVHHVVKDFKENSSMNYGYNFQYHRRAGGGNKDGYSIRVATAELLKRPEKDRILFIFSDGLPSDYAGGEQAGMLDVKMAVKEARSKGIFVVSILFGTETFRDFNIEKYKFMYEKNIISCAPSEITSQLTKMLKKILSR